MGTAERRTETAANPARGPCTASTARCSTATSYHFDTPECCKSHVRRLVHDVGAALTAAGVRWWLDYGSLLGAIRNPMRGFPPGIIPHDKDADLGFLGEDWPKVLAIVPEWKQGPLEMGRKVNRTGYALGYQWLHKLPRVPLKTPGSFNFHAGDSIKVRLSAVNHTNVDIFPWYDRPYLKRPDGSRHRYHYVSVDQYKGRAFHESKLLPLTTHEWEGVELPVPADPKFFCEHRYGPGWQTPIKRNNAGIRR